jgi:hypothetical protein
MVSAAIALPAIRTTAVINDEMIASKEWQTAPNKS